MTKHEEEFEGIVYPLNTRDERITFGIKKWSGYIKGFANRFKNPVSGFEDFVQEANLIIINASDSWDPEKGKFSTYVRTCLHTRLIDFSTRNRGAVSIPSGSIKPDGAKNIRVSLSEDALPEIHDPIEYADWMDELESFEHFSIGYMYLVEGRTLEEISEATGIPASTAQRRISEMRNLIAEKIKYGKV